MDRMELVQSAKKGFNTWDTTSVLSYVLLPYGFNIRLGIKDFKTGQVLNNVLVGQTAFDKEIITPGIRSYDGSYTELMLSFGDVEARICTSASEEDQIIYIEPLSKLKKPPELLCSVAMLWNKPGKVWRSDDNLSGEFGNQIKTVYVRGKHIDEYNTYQTNPYIAVEMTSPIVISTNNCTEDTAKDIIAKAKAKVLKEAQEFGDNCECYTAMKSCLAWDTIYEPQNDTIFSPVSRGWSISWGGYVLFCWDTFFAVEMAGVDNKELAYLNCIGILNEITENGFVPNFGAADDYKSRDRSQPLLALQQLKVCMKNTKMNGLLMKPFTSFLIGTHGILKTACSRMAHYVGVQITMNPVLISYGNMRV